MVESGLLDMAVGSLSVSQERLQRVDMSHPYHEFGISMVARKVQGRTDFFQFATPFTGELWSALLIASLVTAVLLWMFESEHNEELSTLASDHADSSLDASQKKMSADPKVEYATSRSTRTVQEILTSLYLSFTIAVQAQHIAPVTWSGRLVSLGFVFTMMILVSSYTANLASFLTNQDFTNPIQGIHSIGSALEISRIGVVAHDEVSDYFSRVVGRGALEVAGVDDLVRALKDGLVDAIIYDAPLMRYLVNNIHCDLEVVGGEFFALGYSFALKKNSSLTEKITFAMLDLRLQGFADAVASLIEGPGVCSTSSSSGSTTFRFTFQHVAGVFVVYAIIGGISVAVFVASHKGEWAAALRCQRGRFLEALYARTRPVGPEKA